jgi:hypothetical protein
MSNKHNVKEDKVKKGEVVTFRIFNLALELGKREILRSLPPNANEEDWLKYNNHAQESLEFIVDYYIEVLQNFAKLTR